MGAIGTRGCLRSFLGFSPREKFCLNDNSRKGQDNDDSHFNPRVKSKGINDDQGADYGRECDKNPVEKEKQEYGPGDAACDVRDPENPLRDQSERGYSHIGYVRACEKTGHKYGKSLHEDGDEYADNPQYDTCSQCYSGRVDSQDLIGEGKARDETYGAHEKPEEFTASCQQKNTCHNMY